MNNKQVLLLNLSIRELPDMLTWCFMLTGQKNQCAFSIFKDVCKTDLNKLKSIYTKTSLALRCKVSQMISAL